MPLNTIIFQKKQSHFREARLQYLNIVMEKTFAASQISRSGNNRMPESEKSFRNIFERFQKAEWQNDKVFEKEFKTHLETLLNRPQKDLQQQRPLYLFSSPANLGDQSADSNHLAFKLS